MTKSFVLAGIINGGLQSIQSEIRAPLPTQRNASPGIPLDSQVATPRWPNMSNIWWPSCMARRQVAQLWVQPTTCLKYLLLYNCVSPPTRYPLDIAWRSKFWNKVKAWTTFCSVAWLISSIEPGQHLSPRARTSEHEGIRKGGWVSEPSWRIEMNRKQENSEGGTEKKRRLDSE